MKIESPLTLARFRSPGRCEFCQQPGQREAAHVLSAGAGRMDIGINLVSLGLGPWAWAYGGRSVCCCHVQNHQGKPPTREDLLEIVARRESVAVGDLEAALYLIRRLPNGARRDQVIRELSSVSEEARRLVVRELAAIPDYWRRIEPLPGWDASKVEPPF